jgi:hypothetical protein
MSWQIAIDEPKSFEMLAFSYAGLLVKCRVITERY